jgi:Arc/MetJ-type ribon-helix-helix transcriptional regulator
MDILLPTEFESLVRRCLASRRYKSRQDVLRAALELLREEEDFRAEIKKGIDDIKNGNYTEYKVDKPGTRERFVREIEAGSKTLRTKRRKNA